MSSFHIKRPNNSFMLYAQKYRPILSFQNKHLSNSQISSLLGNQWLNASPDERKYYKDLAHEAQIEHQKMYPDYIYCPKKTKKHLHKERKNKPDPIKRPIMKRLIMKRKCNDKIKINIPPKGSFEDVDFHQLLYEKKNYNPTIYIPPFNGYLDEVDEFDELQLFYQNN